MSTEPISVRRVSVILPTYNRAKFLPAAIAAIRGQAFENWELIVVDDGSTDETSEMLPGLVEGMTQPYQYIRQTNQGAYPARNRGLDVSRGDLIAFYDSDDVWLPHHLANCVAALDENPDLGWVYAACQVVDSQSGRIVNENSFYENGQPRPFRRLPVTTRGRLNVLQPEGLLLAVLNDAGLHAGLQNSVVRRRVFDEHRMVTDFYNEAEDQVVVMRSLASGVGFAYFDDVHVIYRIHDGNSSAAAIGMSRDKRLRLSNGMIRGFEELSSQARLDRECLAALRRKVARHYVWDLGYNVHRLADATAEARLAYWKGCCLDPFKFVYWKMYLGSFLPHRGSARGNEVRSVSVLSGE